MDATGQMIHSFNDVTIGIIDTLNAQGVPPQSYRLYDHVDPEALARVIESCSDTFLISIVVEGYKVDITADGIAATPVA